jgi:hypothetical protein
MQFGDTFGPPWAAGPELVMCDQTGEIPLVIQYLTQSGHAPAPLIGGNYFGVESSYSWPAPVEKEFTLNDSLLDGPDVTG